MRGASTRGSWAGCPDNKMVGTVPPTRGSVRAMTYHLSSEQYQRGVDYLASVRVGAAQKPPPPARFGFTAEVLGMAEMLAHLAHTDARKVMRDSDARLTDLESPLTPTLRGH